MTNRFRFFDREVILHLFMRYHLGYKLKWMSVKYDFRFIVLLMIDTYFMLICDLCPEVVSR